MSPTALKKFVQLLLNVDCRIAWYFRFPDTGQLSSIAYYLCNNWNLKKSAISKKTPEMLVPASKCIN